MNNLFVTKTMRQQGSQEIPTNYVLFSHVQIYNRKMDAIIFDFLKTFDLVSHGRLLVKIANWGVDTRVVVWVRVFLTGRKHSVRVGG
jgi:hypothetical protein